MSDWMSWFDFKMALISSSTKKLNESRCCLTRPLTLRKAGSSSHLSYSSARSLIGCLRLRLTSTDLAPFAYHSALCLPPYVSFINLAHSSSPTFTTGLTSTGGLTLLPLAAARCGILGFEGPAAPRGRPAVVPAGLPAFEVEPGGFVPAGVGLLTMDALGGIFDIALSCV